jgi:hypothetical protein
MALANQTYWSANSTFDEGGCGVYQAAGDKSYNQADVRAAFALVGVNTCDAPPPPGVLVKGVAQTISGGTGSETHWEFDATDANSSVTFNMSGGSGDADLYIKLGSAPTSSSYDCRPYASGNTEACNFTAAGTYYVMVTALTQGLLWLQTMTAAVLLLATATVVLRVTLILHLKDGIVPQLTFQPEHLTLLLGLPMVPVTLNCILDWYKSQ